MKKILFAIAALCMGIAVNAQTPVFYENFDGCSTQNPTSSQQYVFSLPDGWTCFKLDNAGNYSDIDYFSDAWAVVNFTSGKALTCITYAATSGQAVDRWVVTPAITIEEGNVLEFLIGGGGNVNPDILSIYAAGPTASTSDDFLAGTCLLDHQNFGQQGMSDYATFGLSLAALEGQTVRLAFRATSVDEWLLRLDEIKVYTPFSNDIAVVSVDLPSYGYVNQDVTVSGTFENAGTNAITSLTMQYTINGGEPIVQTLSDINIDFHGTYAFSFTTPLNEANAGLYTIEVSVTEVNGVSDPNLTNNSASASVMLYDPALLADRTVLVEQFTGNQCGYCPGGHDRLMAALGQFSGDYVYVTHHAGYNQDALTTEYDTGLTGLYGGSTFAPAMCIDRTRFDASQSGPVGSIYSSTSDILSTLNQAKGVPSSVEIAISGVNFDEATRKVTGTVTGQFKNQDIVEGARLTVYLLEDSIVMTQSDYVNGTQTQYRHMNTCRTSLTGVWGEAPSVAADGSFTYNIDYTLPEVVTTGQAKPMNVPYRTHVVAFVSNYNSNDIFDCKVYNAAKSPKLNGNHVNINDVAEVSVSLYPNPATDYVVLQSNCQMQEVMIVNTLGQVVYTNSQVNNSEMIISTTDLPAGLYIATVKGQNGISTQRFTVAR